MKKFSLVLAVLMCTMYSAPAQFQRSYFQYLQNAGSSVQPTTFDPGYILAGAISDDAFSAATLLKTDPDGNQEWVMQYGGPREEWFTSVREIKNPFRDERYVALGVTYSFGETDILFTVLNDKGIPIHSWIYGGNNYDFSACIQPVNDEVFGPGYIIVGLTESFADVLPTPPNNGALDRNVLVIRTDLTGKPLRSAIYGTKGNQAGLWIEQTRNKKGYIITGTSAYACVPTNDPVDSDEIYVLRLDANLNLLWDRVIGGNGNDTSPDQGFCVKENGDGSFLITGNTGSFGLNGSSDAFLLNLSAKGNFGWMKTYGLGSGEFATGLTLDGPDSTQTWFTGLGYTYSTEDGVPDAFLFRTDEAGTLLGSARYGMQGFNATAELARGYNSTGHVFTGYTQGRNGRLSEIYLVETDKKESTRTICEERFKLTERSHEPCITSYTKYAFVVGGERIDLPFEQITVNEDQCSSIRQETSTGSKVILYPNPSTNEITYVSKGKSGIIRIVDTNGEVRIKETFEPGQKLIDVSGLAKGIYVVEIINEDGSVELERLVKE